MFCVYLEMVLDIWEVVNDFYNSKYTSCFVTLDGMREVFILDIYFGVYIDVLYKCIWDWVFI